MDYRRGNPRQMRRAAGRQFVEPQDLMHRNIIADAHHTAAIPVGDQHIQVGDAAAQWHSHRMRAPDAQSQGTVNRRQWWGHIAPVWQSAAPRQTPEASPNRLASQRSVASSVCIPRACSICRIYRTDPRVRSARYEPPKAEYTLDLTLCLFESPGQILIDPADLISLEPEKTIVKGNVDLHVRIGF
jgi:hypothetical protein